MPRQNRVTPFGEIIACPERGTLMGNRGILHGEDAQVSGRLTARRWSHRRWIACLLDFKGRQRQVMTPGQYTELFFLDEATALAAGHRPCAECRRADFNRFVGLWRAANEPIYGPQPTIDTIDRVLHRERVDARTKRQLTYVENLDKLPDGTFVTLTDGTDGAPETAYLVWADALLAWSPGGYTSRLGRTRDMRVMVLTPVSIVRTLSSGYTPTIHSSASP